MKTIVWSSGLMAGLLMLTACEASSPQENSIEAKQAAQLATVQYEAENAILSGGANKNTNHTGYSGTGFVDGFYFSTTAQVSFSVSAASTGSYTVALRYSAGNGTSSNTGLYVNGTKIKTVTFNSTPSWDTWATESETVTLKAGSNTIAYKADTSSGSCINLDNLAVTQLGTCAPSCAGKCGGSDGCGGTCPNNCVSPQTCGGGGTANVCGCSPNCSGKCGGSNGCGGTCSNNCVSPMTCGGGGTTNVCGCSPNCAGKCGGSDGCGGTCPNNCVSPMTCGGGGTTNVCGCSPNCSGKCGGANGCGGTCPNNCVSPQTCGGGGTANVCGCSPNCVGKCGGADGCGGTCPICGCTPNCTGKCGGADGCSGTCPNNCVSPTTCGGGGTANVCGCTPSCAGKCGGSDGCGGTCPNCGGAAYEAENAALSGGANKNTNHSGYSGTGFVDGYYNSTTAQTSFTVTAVTAGSYSVALHYSAGNGTSSNTGFYVNGIRIKTITFNATSNWDTWADETETVSLKAGSNTIAYKAEISSVSCINLDKLVVSSNVCTPSCSGKCGGSDGCGGTCPNNCASPNTCGGGGTANVCGCTPNCSGKCGGSNGCGGTCPNNCSSGQQCNPNGQCSCPQKSSFNLLANPGFDGSLASWTAAPTPNGTAVYSTDDADGCSGSGSVKITGDADVFQCVNVSQGVTYNFGVTYKGILFCQVQYYSTFGCGMPGFAAGPMLVDTTFPGPTVWTPRSIGGSTTPTGTLSMSVDCSGIAGDGQVDKIYLNTVSNGF